MFLHRFSKVRAPEFPKGLNWLNGEPKTMKSLLGKVVLVDFWTYSCVNCIRTLPHLRAWQEKYASKGLVIIGVHTPEFAFEKEEANVKEAIKRFDIRYLVVQDNDYKIWHLYANRWWPRKFLVDASGSIVYDHVGEGGYAETEQAIQRALTAIGATDLPEIEPDMSIGGGICYRTTPETYLGFLRGNFGNAESFLPNAERAFTLNDTQLEDDTIYLHGHFAIHGEYLEHTRTLAAKSEYLALKYSAFSVNLVMESVKETSVLVEVELDNKPLPEDMFGNDVKLVDGKAMVEVSDSRMYRIVNAETYHKGVLKLKVASQGLRMYAFTFGGCKEM